LTSGDDFIVKYGWNIPEKFQDGKSKKIKKKMARTWLDILCVY